MTASPAVEVVTAPPSSSSASPVITAASPPTISGWASIVRGGSSSASTPRAATQPASKSALPAQNTAAPASAIQVYRDSDTWQKKNTKNRRMSEASSSTSVSVHRRAASHSVGSASAAPATHFRNGSLSSTSPPVRLDPNVSLCKQKKPPWSVLVSRYCISLMRWSKAISTTSPKLDAIIRSATIRMHISCQISSLTRCGG